MKMKFLQKAKPMYVVCVIGGSSEWKLLDFLQNYQSWKACNGSEVLTSSEIAQMATASFGLGDDGMGADGNGDHQTECDAAVVASKKQPDPKNVIKVRVSDLQRVGGHNDEVAAIYGDAESIHQFAQSVCFSF